MRDITVSLLNEVCHNVATEPLLEPLSGEFLNDRTANTDDGTHLYINAFFNVRVFHPIRGSHSSPSRPRCNQLNIVHASTIDSFLFNVFLHLFLLVCFAPWLPFIFLCLPCMTVASHFLNPKTLCVIYHQGWPRQLN